MTKNAEDQGKNDGSAACVIPRLVGKSATTRRFGLACVATVGLLLSTVFAAQATFIQNTFGLSDPHSTITFTEHVFGDGYAITTEYADLGVEFLPFAYSFPSICECVTSFIPYTQETQGLRLIKFSQPQTEAAFAFGTYPGTVATFQALLGGSVVVESATAVIGSSDANHYGFRDITFDMISISTNNWPAWNVSDLQFGSRPISQLFVTIRDTAGSAISGADVVVIDSDGTKFSAVAGSDGVASLDGLFDGGYTIYAWAPGYLPGVGQATQAQGAGSTSVTLRSGALAMTDLQSQRLTYDEIVAAGIDPNDPNNQNVFQFEVHLCFSETGVCGSLSGYIGDGDSGSHFIFPDAQGGSCTSGACAFSAGGENGSVAVGSPQVVEGQPSIFWLVIPGKASWLKEFFAVRIVVSNLADTPFSFTQGSATLALPDGLSLAPTSTPQSLTVQMADIPGQSSGAADWVIRGDVAGEYNLAASYAGVLLPFERSVQFVAQTLNPIKVWGGDAVEMIIDTDAMAFRMYPYRLRIGLHNVTATDPAQATDVYNPAVQLLNTGRQNFIWQPRQQMLFGTEFIHPGDTFWTDDIILVPAHTGILDVSASFVKKTAGNLDVANQIINHVPIQDPSTAPVFRATGPGSLTWGAVLGAEGYQLFRIPAVAGEPFPTHDFPDAPFAETTGTSTSVTGAGGDQVWYAVSAVIGGRNVMFHPIIEALDVCSDSACPALDTVVLPLRPLNVALRAGKSSVAKNVRVTVRNAGPASQTIQLVASEGDCPGGTLAGLPDFDTHAAGAQDTATLAAGRSKTAVVPLSIASAAFTNATTKTPTRCTLSFTANTLPAGQTYDPTPANNTAILELNVLDGNDNGTAPPHETYVRSVAPLTVSLRAGVSTVTKTTAITVGNGDVGEKLGHDVSVTASGGDCPAGTVGAVDFDSRTSGAQSSAMVRGGMTKAGTLKVTINAGAFSTPNRKAPARCTALITATGRAGDTDASNNTTKLVIDAIDRNDF